MILLATVCFCYTCMRLFVIRKQQKLVLKRIRSLYHMISGIWPRIVYYSVFAVLFFSSIQECLEVTNQLILT